VVYGLYLAVLLVLAIVVHAPQIAYDVLAGVLHGPTGVAMVLGMWNVWCGFSPFTTRASALVLLCGVYSHLMRLFQATLVSNPPKRVAKTGFEALKERRAERERAESACISRLKRPYPPTADEQPPQEQQETEPRREPAVEPDDPRLAHDGNPVSDEGVDRGRQHEVGETCHGPSSTGRLNYLLQAVNDVLREEERRRQDQAERGLCGQAFRA
jgi:hypothetical protein